jgi:hypothetical protein
MKRAQELMLLVMIFVSIIAMPSTQADNPADWEIEVVPSFAFISENVTVITYGTPGVYFVIRVYDIYNQSVSDAFIPVNEQGISEYDFEIPLEAPAGIYHAEATFEGEVVANESFEVIFDEILYNKVRLDLLEEELKETETLMTQYRNTLIKVLNERESLRNVAMIAVTISVICMAFIIWKFRPFFSWMGSFYREERKRNFWKLVLSPEPRGYMGILMNYVPGELESYQKKRREDIRKKEGMGIEPFQPFITFRNKEGEVIRKEVQIINPNDMKFGKEVGESIMAEVKKEGAYSRLGRWCDNLKANRKARASERTSKKKGRKAKKAKEEEG